MRKLLIILFFLTTQSFAESTSNNVESEQLIKSCKHALELLLATTPKLIDFEASGCINKAFQYSSTMYSAKQAGAIADICISKELAFPAKDMKTNAIPVKAITDFVEQYPEALQYDPNALIVMAYSEAFSCEP